MRIPLLGRQRAVEAVSTSFVWLSPAEAQARLESGDVQLIDVREEWEFAAGHLAGSRCLPLRTLLRQARLELTRDNIVFVCAVGERATVACEMAASLGFTQVFNIRGGVRAWLASGLPVET